MQGVPCLSVLQPCSTGYYGTCCAQGLGTRHGRRLLQRDMQAASHKQDSAAVVRHSFPIGLASIFPYRATETFSNARTTAYCTFHILVPQMLMLKTSFSRFAWLETSFQRQARQMMSNIPVRTCSESMECCTSISMIYTPLPPGLLLFVRVHTSCKSHGSYLQIRSSSICVVQSRNHPMPVNKYLLEHRATVESRWPFYFIRWTL
jgi:hypothetical protein